MSKKQIISIVVILVVVIGLVYLFSYLDRPEVPTVAADGTVSGQYSIDGILALGQPYECTFEKEDQNSMVAGVVQTDGKSVYGQFRILSSELEGEEFNSYLIIKNGETYTWTSLAPVGFKAPVARSANTTASPTAQAQLVGTRDELNYECKPWSATDQTVFDTPSWITFSQI